ncbi:MAG: glutamine--fructose-6-phosphate transaminase (isomerizing), partial [Candidatus Binatia bacterium]
MCGIAGYIGHREAAEVVIPALRRLEYRGYDSAGIASLDGRGIEVLRSVGKLSSLESLLARRPIRGNVGIGHTRWATHGRVSEENAHPHVAGRVAVIHNGIIENFLELRAELAARGRRLRSETDTEVIAHLVDESLEGGMDFGGALRAAVRRLEGSFALVAMDADDPGRLFAAKTATPIVVGVGEGENFVASDVPALLDYTRRVIFLEDGELAEITRDGVEVTDFDGAPRRRQPRTIQWDAVTAQKGGYRHFLLKEIHEQPEGVRNTLRARFTPSAGVRLRELDGVAERIRGIDRVSLVACGTAWHACLVGKFFLSELTGLCVDVDYGSEFRYRKLGLGGRDLFVAVSQSGETADTLGSLEEAKRLGATALAVCNVVDSSIARRADAVVYTQAGPEISVCSTKAFTTQLAALLLLSLDLGRRLRRVDEKLAAEIAAALPTLPEKIEAAALAAEAAVEAIARE